jgi:hypothetical protein
MTQGMLAVMVAHAATANLKGTAFGFFNPVWLPGRLGAFWGCGGPLFQYSLKFACRTSDHQPGHRPARAA